MSEQPALPALLFSGLRVIESVWLTVDGEPCEVRRSWSERLFSRPWRPFKATRTVIPKLPHPGAIQLDTKTIMMHPETYRQLKQLTSR